MTSHLFCLHYLDNLTYFSKGFFRKALKFKNSFKLSLKNFKKYLKVSFLKNLSIVTFFKTEINRKKSKFNSFRDICSSQTNANLVKQAYRVFYPSKKRPNSNISKSNLVKQTNYNFMHLKQCKFAHIMFFHIITATIVIKHSQMFNVEITLHLMLLYTYLCLMLITLNYVWKWEKQKKVFLCKMLFMEHKYFVIFSEN